MTLSLMTFSITTPSVVTFSVVTFSRMTLSITALSKYPECHYAVCCVLFIVMLNAIRLTVVMLSVVVPYSELFCNFLKGERNILPFTINLRGWATWPPPPLKSTSKKIPYEFNFSKVTIWQTPTALIPGKSFQPSAILSNKATTYPSGAHWGAPL